MEIIVWQTEKKGQGEFVAYVLLIGLAVTLSIIIGRWSIGQSQSTSQNFVRQSEIEDKCGQIALSASVDCSGLANQILIKITNRGYLKIEKVKITGENGINCMLSDQPNELDIELYPQKETQPNIQLSDRLECKKIYILPLMKISNEETIGSSDKTAEITIPDSCRTPNTNV